MKKTNWLRVVASLATLALTSGCGKSGWVSDAKLRTYSQNSQIYGELDMQISLGGFVLGDLPQIPIPHPRNPGKFIGYVDVRPVLSDSKKSDLIVAVNLTEVAKIRGGSTSATLPNGTPLSNLIGGVDVSSILSFQLGGRSSRAYVSLDPANQKALIGVALVIPALDGVAGRLPIPIDLFPPFQLKNGARGVFGLFTSPSPNQSGFATIVDASALLQPSVSQSLMVTRNQVLGTNALATRAIASSYTNSPSRIVFKNVAPAKERHQRQVERGLYNLSNKRTQLNIR